MKRKDSELRLQLIPWLLFILVFPLNGYTTQAQTKPQWWFTYNHSARLSERWSYVFDLNYRTNGLVPLNSSLTAARMGMQYHTPNGFRFVGGYAWFGTFTTSNDRIWLNENRLYEQAQYNHGSGKIKFSHRIRIEQRWRQLFTDSEQNKTDVYFTNRSRYLFQLDGPITRSAERQTNLRWQFTNEIFFHNKEEIGYTIFDQNRTLAGVLISPPGGLSLAVLYQLIIQQQPYLREIRTINSFRITLFHQLDFRKNKKKITVEEIPVID